MLDDNNSFRKLPPKNFIFPLPNRANYRRNNWKDCQQAILYKRRNNIATNCKQSYRF